MEQFGVTVSDRSVRRLLQEGQLSNLPLKETSALQFETERLKQIPGEPRAL